MHTYKAVYAEINVEYIDAVVVGAGVVGLAVARALALQGREVMVLEALPAFGTVTSARNSEVIHAGLYYPAGSLKARLCVQGRDLLYAYCAQRGVPYRRCGKWIVATSEAQTGQLRAIWARAQANGVGDLVWLDAAELRAREPALVAVAALESPSTGIVDSHALMLALLGDLEHAGGCLAVSSPVASIDARLAVHGAAGCQGDGRLRVHAQDGTVLAARTVVNAAGHGAPLLAGATLGLAPVHVPRAYWAKGSYFTLSGRAPFSRLIYPVPEVAGLGVHLTLDMGGQARFGPDVEWVTSPDDVQVNPARAALFEAEVRRYWPALPDGALQPGYAGLRPKISGPDAPASDFVIQGPAVHGIAGLVNLLGIESPGLTSCLAIAQQVVHELGQER
jgi:L-2-hydroxyglutarate oxidase LhgO